MKTSSFTNKYKVFISVLYNFVFRIKLLHLCRPNKWKWLYFIKQKTLIFEYISIHCNEETPLLFCLWLYANNIIKFSKNIENISSSCKWDFPLTSSFNLTQVKYMKYCLEATLFLTTFLEQTVSASPPSFPHNIENVK